jgi:hypothetical protein
MLNQYVILKEGIRWRFPSSTERLAYVATAAEVPGVAWQRSDNSLWLLVAAPSTWIGVGVNSSNFLTLIADGALSGHRVVVPTTSGKAGYADKATPAHANKIIGITKGAAADLATVEVQYDGEMTEPSWTWTTNLPIYCGASGVLTQVPPSSGFVQQVGVALSPTKMSIGILQSITLS